mmetsp:Transcript_1080/g.2412  ORF Transcript_1080/g.2412 Transcript_1080/m.2412 type:complete len:717 (-) Transcript_1080:421-2571(-)
MAQTISSWSSRLVFAVLATASFLEHNSVSVDAEIQNGAVSDTTPNLPFGDINVVVMTDVHSWLASHRHQEPYLDADLGDVLSFWGRLKEYCQGDDDSDASATGATTIATTTGNNDEQQQGCENIFFVNNGDFVDGTGLSQTIDGQNNPEYLVPLLEKMPYDAVNVGNHELYCKKNIEYMTRPGGYVDWWGDRYLTSNINKVPIGPTADSTRDVVVSADDKEPLGNRYKLLHGPGSNLLVFGFLYNMRGYADDAGIEIEHVQTAVAKQWFVDALTKEDYDAVLVLAHMDLVDPLVQVIRTAVREQIGEEIPVVFVTGHTHYRGVKQFDDRTITFEAGRYLDTVGFISLPKKESVRGTKPSSSVFGHAFLDASRKVLFQDTLGFSSVEDGPTKDGKDLSAFIDHTRKKLGLEREIGCAPHSYFVNRHLDAPDSMWGLYRDQVIPKMFSTRKAMAAIGEEAVEEEDDLPMAMLLATETWRYDLHTNSTLVVDDINSIAPFNDTVVYLGVFSSEVIFQANHTLNKYHNDGDSVWKHFRLPKFIMLGDIIYSESSATSPSGSENDHSSITTTKYNLYTHDFNAKQIQKVLKKIAPTEKSEITKTQYTSTLIWLGFVEKYWSCDRAEAEIPERHPGYHSVINHAKHGHCGTTMLLKAFAVLVGLYFILKDKLRKKRPGRLVDVDLWFYEDTFYTKVEGQGGLEKDHYRTKTVSSEDKESGLP